MYLTKAMVQEALLKVQQFEHELNDLFNSHGYDLRGNLGRRNALCSQAQEKELAAALRQRFESVVEDGAPGKPDIFIGDINKELECKLTSGNRSSSVSYSLQTDWATLQNKGSLDYLYVLCDDKFEKFCAIFFKDLTVEDFYPPANGSRGKARMNKNIAMKKATPLWGSFKTQNEVNVNNYKSRVWDLVEERSFKIKDMKNKLSDFVSSNNEFVQKAQETKKKIDETYLKKIDVIFSKINYWLEADDRYSFILEPLTEEA